MRWRLCGGCQCRAYLFEEFAKGGEEGDRVFVGAEIVNWRLAVRKNTREEKTNYYFLFQRKPCCLMKGNFEFPSFFSVLHFLLFSDFRLFFFIFHLFYFPFFPRPKKSFKKFQQVHSKVKSSFVHYRCTLNHRVVDSQMD